jgi:hypothetical protein
MKLERTMFLIAVVVIIAFAFLPYLGFSDILNPNCGLTGTCTRYISVYSELHRNIYQTWEITELTADTRGPINPQMFALLFPSGEVCVKIKLYENQIVKQSGQVCNPNPMDLAGLDPASSTWGTSWAFMKVPNGNYQVGSQYFDNGNPITGEQKVNVVVDDAA